MYWKVALVGFYHSTFSDIFTTTLTCAEAVAEPSSLTGTIY